MADANQITAVLNAAITVLCRAPTTPTSGRSTCSTIAPSQSPSMISQSLLRNSSITTSLLGGGIVNFSKVKRRVITQDTNLIDARIRQIVEKTAGIFFNGLVVDNQQLIPGITGFFHQAFDAAFEQRIGRG
jgi:hypothetical protein